MQNRLKQLRIALNIKQGDLAKKLGVVQQQLSKYERGENKPSVEFLIKLHELFNVNIDWLLTGAGTMFIGGESEFDIDIKFVKLKKGQLLKIEYED